MFPLDRYTYIVQPDKGRVIAYSSYAGKTVKGIAKCAPEDKFDADFGKKLAAARCNMKICIMRKKELERKWYVATDIYLQAQKDRDMIKDYYYKAEDAIEEAHDFLNELTIGG